MYDVAVTGARGIIGRRFCEAALAAGHRISTFEGDVRQPAALASWLADSVPDAVVHCAAMVEVARVNAEPARAFDINVGGTLNLMRALADLKRKPWVFYASTSHVYAPARAPIAESHPVAPRNVYSLTKRLGEETASFFADVGRIDLCIGRIFSIYDPEQTGSYLYAMMAARVASQPSDIPIAVADGGSVRDFSSAAAIVASMLRLMERRATGIVNVGSGEGRSVVDHLDRLFGPHATFVAEPSDTTSIVADVGLLKRLSA